MRGADEVWGWFGLRDATDATRAAGPNRGLGKVYRPGARPVNEILVGDVSAGGAKARRGDKKAGPVVRGRPFKSARTRARGVWRVRAQSVSG